MITNKVNEVATSKKHALLFKAHFVIFFSQKLKKIDGVGPVDNRPSTNKLHPFVQKKKKKKRITCDT